jgi:hypothetical protein
MKRFILYLLSATVALTVGSVARAGMQEDAVRKDADLTGGIISPDDQSPNNREIPQRGALEYDNDASMSEDAELVEGVISPDSESPYNREIPGEGALDDENEAMDAPEDDDRVDGIIVPDSSEPYNREEVE